MFANKRFSKKEKQKNILLGVVDLFIKSNKPVGSNVLKEKGFGYLSSATIRNYFVKLEKDGYLTQQHSSGGRIPTAKAYREYAKLFKNNAPLSEKEKNNIKNLMKRETKQLNAYLNEVAEILSNLTDCVTFVSSIRFDQDVIEQIKLLKIDQTRLLCIILTSFGQIKTEILFVPENIESENIQQIENFIHWRLNKNQRPSLKNEKILKQAQRVYNEIMIRHVANHVNFEFSEIYKTGFSKLLNYPEFQDPYLLATSLSVFEDEKKIINILNKAIYINSLNYNIGQEFDLNNVSIITIPYYVNNTPVGAIAVFGPLRIPYKTIFGILIAASKYISDSITRSTYKFKLTFKNPCSRADAKKILLDYNASSLIEDKRRPNEE